MNAKLKQLVVFGLGSDLFGAEIVSVERVLRHQAPTPLPDVPPWLAGVIEYRTKMVPVVDLRARFELPVVPVRNETRILILNARGDWMGVIVDSVMEVASVPAGEIATPPALFRGLAAEYLKGILTRGDKLVIIHDVDRLLSATDRVILDQTAPEGVSHG